MTRTTTTMTRDKEDGSTQIQVSQMEMWAIRGIGVLLLGLMSWAATNIRESTEQMQQATLAIAEIRTELKLTKPQDVLQALHQLERIVPSTPEIQALVRAQSPWTEVREDWREWRTEVKAELSKRTADRIYRQEVQRWIAQLKNDNPDLKIPALPEF